jgi:hypothetical protein
MSYADDRSNQIQAQIQHLTNLKRVLREREKDLNARARYLDQPRTMPANSVKGLRNALLGNLPSHMVPGNVGGINEVTWPFYFQINMDVGTNPTISSNSLFKGFFQVDQEAALLLMSMDISYSTNALGQSATSLAPLQVDLIDRQSSRRFSNEPIPLQMIGHNSNPSIMPTPMYIMPNAFLDVSVSGQSPIPMTYTGSGKFQLSFFGYRIRTEDAGKVLSTIFAATSQS